MTVPLRATYRVQFTPRFRLPDATALVPYLAALGVSHLYASPLLQSRSGSEHGYDVVDPTQLNPELGTPGDLRGLTAELRAHDMGLLLDIVPNHMAVGHENAFWMDVLANGRASRWSHWFDIDWHTPDEELRGRILIPVLGDWRREAVARGEVTLAWTGPRVEARYFEHSFPVDLRTLPRVLTHGLDEQSEVGRALEPLLARYTALPSRSTSSDAERSRRQVEVDALGAELAALVARSESVRAHVEQAVHAFSSGSGAVQRMRRFLEQQAYSLGFWRRAAGEINYRRFFNINELVSLRAQDPRVFAETHAQILAWVNDGTLDGLRVDHIDGLRDPAGYLRRLRDEVHARGGTTDEAVDGRRFPVFVEKILSGSERMPDEWPVDGTTGYEVLNDLDSVFVHPEGFAEIERRYRRMVHDREGSLTFRRAALSGKRKVLRASLAADVSRLVRLFVPIAASTPATTALPRTALETAMVELLAHFPVYRTYVAGSGPAGEADAAVIRRAVNAANESGQAERSALELLGNVLLGSTAEDGTDLQRQRTRLASRFEQVSGPAAAKGVEDTAHYLYVPLISLNEVGGEPDRELDESVPVLHEANSERQMHWPRSLVCTSTHDTKRGADTRARLNVVSELPDEWRRRVVQWRRLNRRWVQRIGRRTAPDTNNEYLLYQTLAGIWPVDANGRAIQPVDAALDELRERAQAYMEKAVREAKARSGWASPNEPFESALREFTSAVLDPLRSQPFRESMGEFVTTIAPAGAWNAVARTVLHLTVPGTPDIYQGDEIWQHTLVDPDNRRAVDFGRRAATLADITRRFDSVSERDGLLRELISRPGGGDGALKLHVVARLLRLRREHAALFADGEYVAIAAEGERSAHAFAFARRMANDSHVCIVAVPRLTMGLGVEGAPIGRAAWGETRLPLPGSLARIRGWRCALSGREIEGSSGGLMLAQLLPAFPAVVLVGEA